MPPDFYLDIKIPAKDLQEFNKIAAGIKNIAPDIELSPPPLPEILRRARQAKQITQQDLAAGTGVSRAAIQAAEAGRNIPRRSNLKKISATLNLDPGHLLGLLRAEDSQVTGNPTPIRGDLVNHDLENLSFGASVKFLRQDHLMTVRELAKEAHVATSTIVNIEAGRVVPKPKTRRALTEALTRQKNSPLSHPARPA